MAQWPPLRERLPQLLERFGDELVSCQQALEGIWENDEECLFAVLRQAIEYRSAGDQATSLLLLEWLRDQGVEHPLVIDNLIRGLVHSDRFCEATLLLSSLADLDQAEVLQGARDALLLHQQTLRSNLLKHCEAKQLEPVGLELLESIPPKEFLRRILDFAHQQTGLGGAALSKAVLEELMQWGQWLLDALPVDLQRRWAQLVEELEHGLPSTSANRVLMVDQALAWDALILDHLRKLMGPMDLDTFN